MFQLGRYGDSESPQSTSCSWKKREHGVGGGDRDGSQEPRSCSEAAGFGVR